jgi:hypothetical protein
MGTRDTSERRRALTLSYGFNPSAPLRRPTFSGLTEVEAGTLFVPSFDSQESGKLVAIENSDWLGAIAAKFVRTVRVQ